MRLTKSLVLSVLGLVCGALSFLLLVPTGYWTWIGVVCALFAVVYGWFGRQKTKLEQRLSFAGIVLAMIAALLFMAVGMGIIRY